MGSTDKIRHDLTPSGRTQLQQITKEDVDLVASQCDVSHITAKQYLEKWNGDLAKAILEISKWKKP